MNFAKLKKILLRVFNSYVKKHFYKLIIALFLSLVVAGSTGAIAWLLDPAVKKNFHRSRYNNDVINTHSYCSLIFN